MIRGIGAGLITSAVALALGEPLPGPLTCAAAMAMVFVGYGGLMSVLFIMTPSTVQGPCRSAATDITAVIISALKWGTSIPIPLIFTTCTATTDGERSNTTAPSPGQRKKS